MPRSMVLNVCRIIQTFSFKEVATSTYTFSSRDFTRDVLVAKRAAVERPVFITDRGRPAFALLNIEDCYRIVGQDEPTFLSVMDGIPGGDGIEFNPPRLDIQSRPAEFD